MTISLSFVLFRSIHHSEPDHANPTQPCSPVRTNPSFRTHADHLVSMNCCAVPFFPFVHSVTLFRSSAAQWRFQTFWLRPAPKALLRCTGSASCPDAATALLLIVKYMFFKTPQKLTYCRKMQCRDLLSEQFLHSGSFTFDNSKIIDIRIIFHKNFRQLIFGCFRSVLARCGNWCISTFLQLQVSSLIDDTVRSAWSRACGKNVFARTRIQTYVNWIVLNILSSFPSTACYTCMRVMFH